MVPFLLTAMKATLSAPCARTNSRIFCSRGLSGLCSQSASSPRTSEALFRHPTCPCPQPSNGLRGLSVVVRCDALRRLAPRRGGGRFWNPFSQITRKQRNGCKTYLRKKGGRSRSAGVECQPAQAALAKSQSGPKPPGTMEFSCTSIAEIRPATLYFVPAVTDVPHASTK